MMKANKIKRLMICLILLFGIMGLSMAQERINEFVVNVDETHNPMTIYSSYGATPNDGVVIINSTIPNLEFGILSVDKERLRKVVHDKENNRYLLIIKPNDNIYQQYTITVKATNFVRGKIEPVIVKAGLSSSYIVNPKYSGKENVDPLYVNGWDVYRNGKKLSDNEIRAIFANTESYDLYLKGLKWKEGGSMERVMTGVGLGAFSTGAVFVGIWAMTKEIKYANIGLYCAGGGIAVWLSELVILQIAPSVGRNKLQKAVDLYNNRNMRSQNGIELEYGLTGNGVYFSLLF